MSNLAQKRDSIAMPRLFTRGGHDTYALIHFRAREAAGDENFPALECPENWSAEAAEILADEAAFKSVPARLRPVEENTVPSWLWRRAGEAKDATEETGAQQIFDRVVGSAAYVGWTQGLFADESAARDFFDEARYALMQRFIALEPKFLTTLGLDWAYGCEKPRTVKFAPVPAAAISNAMIDAVVGGRADKTMRARWQKLLSARPGHAPVRLNFSDIAADWGAPAAGVPAPDAPVAMVDLMVFRHNDGAVNIEALRHVVRMLVILLDLHGQSALAIGFANLAPLLMALALPYESDAARAMAAALSALMTAEAYATSAELARVRGASREFTARRDEILRALRNYRRGVYGDAGDYEKISVLPAPLALKHCPDLGLAAAAQRRWDEALARARHDGLRHAQVTALLLSPALALFMESATQGIEPLRSLTITRADEEDGFRREIHPSVVEGLGRLGYARATSRAITSFIAGAETLKGAPAINPESLRAKKFDAPALARIENYLPKAGALRLVFTPWVLGQDFCRNVLKIPAAKLSDPRFDLLRHLGFSAADIAAADAYCYGRDTARDCKQLKPQHAGVFARADEIQADARIRMAAAAQGFISGAVALRLSLVAGEQAERLILGAWRQGMKGLEIVFDGASGAVVQDSASAVPRKSRTALFLHAQKPALPARKAKPKTGPGSLGLRRGGSDVHRSSTKRP